MKKVQRFKYLVNVLKKDEKYNAKIRRCIQIVKNAFKMLTYVLGNRNICLDIKKRLLNR